MDISTELKGLLESAMIHGIPRSKLLNADVIAGMWASGLLLKKAEGIIVEMMNPQIFQNMEHLSDLRRFSFMIETVRERIGHVEFHIPDDINSELQDIYRMVTDREGSNAPAAATHRASTPADFTSDHTSSDNISELQSDVSVEQLQDHVGENSNSRRLSPHNFHCKDVPVNEPLGKPHSQVVNGVAVDNKGVYAAQISTVQPGNIILMARHSNDQYTTLSPRQLSKSSKISLGDRSFEDAETTSASAMPAVERNDIPKAKKKKKSKRKKTVSENATEEMVPVSKATGNVPATPYPMSEGYVPPAGPIPVQNLSSLATELGRSAREAIAILHSQSSLKEETKSTSKLAGQKSNQDGSTQETIDKARKIIEELKDEHQKASADIARKYEAIKFENGNLKATRNKELEKLRKENSALREAASNHTERLTKSRSKIHTLESEISEKCEQLESYSKELRGLRATVAKHPDEMKAIRSHRPDLEAHIDTFDANKTLKTIEDNHEDFISSTRHEYRFKDSPSTMPKSIANDPLLSEEGKKICLIMEDLRKDNAELRARCQWYWDLFQAPDKVKQLARDAEESFAGFKAKTAEAEKRLEEVEAGWDREKEWEKKRLLFDVGVAVRKRFFEQSKSMLSDRKAQGRPDYAIIREGNEACHRGDMIADGLLFELGLLSGPDNIIAYRDLYYCLPQSIHTFPSKFSEAIGYLASIRTIDATAASNKYRDEALVCFNSIVTVFKESVTPDDFNASLDIRTLLSQLRELSRDIIRIDRGRWYRGYVEETVDDEEADNNGERVVDTEEHGSILSNT